MFSHLEREKFNFKLQFLIISSWVIPSLKLNDKFVESCYFFVFFTTGSNGAEFMFLLKGHEDLRQDERVMQLFGLVNTLLAGDQETSKRHLG